VEADRRRGNQIAAALYQQQDRAAVRAQLLGAALDRGRG